MLEDLAEEEEQSQDDLNAAILKASLREVREK